MRVGPSVVTFGSPLLINCIMAICGSVEGGGHASQDTNSILYTYILVEILSKHVGLYSEARRLACESNHAESFQGQDLCDSAEN